MANDYLYYYHNGKKIYGGKYPVLTYKHAEGYYGNNEAGNPNELTPKQWGKKSKFIGSNSTLYTFSDTEHGTHTFVASSYKEALQMALSWGYEESDYQSRHKYGSRRKR